MNETRKNQLVLAVIFGAVAIAAGSQFHFDPKPEPHRPAAEVLAEAEAAGRAEQAARHSAPLPNFGNFVANWKRLNGNWLFDIKRTSVTKEGGMMFLTNGGTVVYSDGSDGQPVGFDLQLDADRKQGERNLLEAWVVKSAYPDVSSSEAASVVNGVNHRVNQDKIEFRSSTVMGVETAGSFDFMLHAKP